MLNRKDAPQAQPSAAPAGTSRRSLLAAGSGLIALAGLTACAPAKMAPEAAAVSHAVAPQTPQEALDALQAGNHRFASGSPKYPNQDTGLRTELAGHQAPFALVHGCVDSRVAPELLFDQGIGDLFVTRTAGAVLDDTLVGSMEFAVSAPYAVPLLVILGHTSCGAVTGTLEAMEKNPKKPVLPGEMSDFAQQIVPVARQAEVSGAQPEDVEIVVEANARSVAKALLERSSIIRKAVEENRTQVVSAIYDLSTGKVRWLQ
ncbi:carbonic anhydrase [Glutamicibacter arilaitensis]|uniref:carbonic anhydrase n=1 Tax=Glutamicibacter arilaitensis TaxID=256701 RepID=UPI003A8E8A08